MLNDEQISNEIDLSEHLVVLGSGLNAISTIHGITDNLKENGKKIYVVDAGLTNNNDLKISNLSSNIKMPSPKFKIQANHFVYSSFKGMLNITEKGFEVIGSLAKGGLSNIWGATIQPYSNNELSKFPYTYKEINSVYIKIYQILTGYKDKAFINNDIGNNEFLMWDPLLAINTKKNSSSCYLKSCDNGCIYCNKNIFNSKDEIDNFINLNKIEYMSGLFIKSIMKVNGFYIIKCIELDSNEIISIKASSIYCCLGSISTSKIILGMSEEDDETPLLSTPGGSFFIFSYKNFHKNNNGILSLKSFAGGLGNSKYEGNIFPFSKNLVCVYFGESLGSILNFIFRRFLFSKLFIANIYFDSDMSSSTIIKNNNRLIINSKTTWKLKLFFKKAVSVIKKEFLHKGLLVIPFSKKLMLPGQDIHYGGSAPMKKNPEKNQCNFNGELKGYQNFYITDASSLPFLASKGQSFNSMVNSYYIASKSVSNKNKID